jgi:glycosyltransferase involved in cell wall biosynthesis
MEIDIAIPCYNSAPWLDRTINSILRQDTPSWRIVARDDGSKDTTVDRLEFWRRQLGSRMIVLPNPERRNLGIAGSYSAVLAATAAPWVLTADPDDIWLPGHLERVAEALRQTESLVGAHAPIAVCTDAAVVDEHENPIAASYWRWTRSDPTRVGRVIDIAMESPLLGSTMGVNRALLDVALPIPPEAVGQDWWFALAAAAFGQIRALEEVTILYRRHSSNQSGSPFGSSIVDAVRHSLVAPGSARKRLHKVLFEDASPQARAFVERYRTQLHRRDVVALSALGALGHRGPLARRLSLIHHRLGFASPLKNWVTLALC